MNLERILKTLNSGKCNGQNDKNYNLKEKLGRLKKVEKIKRQLKRSFSIYLFLS